MNTPGHLALQKALGFRTLNYAHMSVTVSEGGGKLSKRERGKVLRKAIKDAQDSGGIDLGELAVTGDIDRAALDDFLAGESSPDQPSISAMATSMGVHLPEINVIDFFHSGYLPEAMLNFVALLGWNPGDNREIMRVEELIEAFDIRRLNKTNSLFDRKKLLSFNTEHMKMVDPETLLGHFKRYLKVVDSPLGGFDDGLLGHILRACQGARTLEEVAKKCLFLVRDEIAFDAKAVKKVLRKANAPELLQKTRDALAQLPEWSEAGINTCIEQLCQENEVGMGKVAQPIRVAITGTTISPPIHDSLILLGKDKTLARIDDTLAMLKNEPAD